MKSRLRFVIIILALASIGYILYFTTRHGDKIPLTVEVLTGDATTANSLYLMSAPDRNKALYQMLATKEYQAVVNATEYGIKNHRDLIWDDVQFWDSRAVAEVALAIALTRGQMRITPP